MARRLFLAFSDVFSTRGGIQRFNQLFCRAIVDLAPVLDLEGRVFSLEADSLRDAHRRDFGPAFSFEACGGTVSLARRLLASCARERPEALLIGHLGMTPLGTACLPFVEKGFVFVAHGCETWRAIPPFSRRFSARRAALVLSVSTFTQLALVRTTGVEPSRIRVLPNTIDPGMEAESEAHPDLGGDDREILTVARLDSSEGWKGVDHTIEAVSRLAPRDAELRLRVVGAGDDKPRLRELAATLGIADRVRFEEGLSDGQLADRYRRCALFALPSRQEGFGIVFLEAMRFGKACIGAREGGIPEVIDEGRTGILVPYGDVDALARAIDSLVGDPGRRRAMGEAGRLRFDTLFAYPRFRERVGDYLREWIGAA